MCCPGQGGNGPSPAVAIYGLRYAIREGAWEYGANTVKFVENSFYVDDALICLPFETKVIDLLQRTQFSLAESNLHLHKFVSKQKAVIDAFSAEDCVLVIKDLDFRGKNAPTQRSLGLVWEIVSDTFTFSVSTMDKPFTGRGVLATVNSVFDPLGLLAPFTIQGRDILRPEAKLERWKEWRDSL